MIFFRPLICVLATAFITAGCSEFPGMHFSGTMPALKIAPTNYVIQAITPELLIKQAIQNASPATSEGNNALAQALAAYTYKVAPHDVLSIIVWGDPLQSALFKSADANSLASAQADTSSSISANPISSAAVNGFKIDTDGSLYFPYVERIAVAGQSTTEIQKKLKQKLEPFIRNPQVTVNVAAFNSQKFELAGAIMKPGLYPISDTPLTVSQAIVTAGGVINQIPTTTVNANTIPRPLGNLSQVTYIHNGQATVLNLRAFYANGDTSQDRVIASGDVIHVPDISQEQVHVLGEVQNPGNYPLNNGDLNLAMLLGEAGSIALNTANPSRILVFRGAYEKPQIFWLDASSPDAFLLANKFALHAQDVVYVASTKLADWNRIIGQILPTIETIYETKALVNH